MSKLCQNENCLGVYEDNGTCSMCGQLDEARLPCVQMTVRAGNYHGTPVPELQVQARFTQAEVAVELFVRTRRDALAAVATTCRTYQDIALSVRSHLEGCDSVRELLRKWSDGRQAEVIRTLVAAHPCVTAVMLVTGTTEGLLTLADCNAITNLLVDNRMDENERLN